jgi:hypothetical protein
MSQEEDLGTVTVEHILPKAPSPKWPKDEVMLEEYLYRIGNMCLLTRVPNKDLASASFDEKKAVYAKSKIILTNQLATVASWDRQAIEHRQARMAKLAASVWRFQ